MGKQYRRGLPEPMPVPIRMLPVERGYPVPWFVSKVGEHYDFRVADRRKIVPAVRNNLCWICGQRMGHEFVFPIGPMCAVNRTTSEPPSHAACARWSAIACPFLLNKEADRRAGNYEGGVVPVEVPGTIRRQPGVVLLWRCAGYKPFRSEGDVLFTIGTPLGVEWLREGRTATREEVEASVYSGLPLLEEMCDTLRDREALERAIVEARALFPVA